MPTISALNALPSAWQDWIHENLARSCDPEQMAIVMERDGHFDGRLARAAIGEANAARFAETAAARPMPVIDTSVNTIRLPDRDIHVLLTLQTPRVVLLGNVLSDVECEELIAYANQRLARSPVVSDVDGKEEVHAHRTSRGAMLQLGETGLVARIEARIAALIDWPVERGEGLQILRYEKGNEYRPHYDWFDPSLPGPRKQLERGGQRLATVILYLNDVEQGGGTTLPNIGLEVQPRKGNALFFANTDVYHQPDLQTLHAGEPVEKGVKYIATKWLRQTTFR